MRTIVVLGALTVALAGCGGGEEAPPDVVAAAKRAHAEAKARGVDMSPGPCLGVVAPDWVADVAHEPRQDVDDEPANQCEAYRTGEVHHFVELDPAGTLIRSQ